MRLVFAQVRKTTMTAQFVLSRAGQAVGEMAFEGLFGTDEGNWSGQLYGHGLNMSYTRGLVGGLLPDARTAYEVLFDNRSCGAIVRDVDSMAAGTNVKQFQLNIDGRILCEYPFARGLKGYRYPIFEGARQIAELAKGCKVKSDLHTFEVAVVDDADAWAVLALCCYTYTQSWWSPGPAAKGHTHLYVQGKTSPAVGDAYDAGFMDQVAV